MDIDIWQIAGTIAALAFTAGFIDQLRVTFKTKDVNGISLIQWIVFALHRLYLHRITFTLVNI